MKIKAFLLTLVVILGILTTSGCGEKNREYVEEEVKRAANELILKSELLNELYYGYGIAYDDNKSEADGRYYKASLLSANEFGVDTVEDIKVLTRECFSTEYANLLIDTKLSSVKDDEGVIVSYVRYYQKYNALDGSEECIMVDSEATVLIDDELEYDYNSLYVSHSEGEEVIVKISVTVTDADGNSQKKELEISLIEEADGWRINSPTYTTYFDRTQYDDLQK